MRALPRNERFLLIIFVIPASTILMKIQFFYSPSRRIKKICLFFSSSWHRKSLLNEICQRTNCNCSSDSDSIVLMAGKLVSSSPIRDSHHPIQQFLIKYLFIALKNKLMTMFRLEMISPRVILLSTHPSPKLYSTENYHKKPILLHDIK